VRYEDSEEDSKIRGAKYCTRGMGFRVLEQRQNAAVGNRF